MALLRGGRDPRRPEGAARSSIGGVGGRASGLRGERVRSLRAFAASVGDGAGLALEGFSLLARERRLWPLAGVPVALSLLAVGVALAGVIGWAGELYALSSGWLPWPRAERWFEWLWVGPARALLELLGAGLFLALAAGCLVLAWLLASLLAAPFHDALAQRVELLVAGAVPEVPAGLLAAARGSGRAMAEELRRLSFFLAVALPLGLVGLVVPGAQLLTGPALALFTLLFLPLDYASYALDRRRLSFRAKRRWILGHVPVMLGFGGAACLAALAPGVNLVAMPALVVGGTLVALRHPPEAPPTRAPARAPAGPGVSAPAGRGGRGRDWT
jgi:CysZ protein